MGSDLLCWNQRRYYALFLKEIYCVLKQAVTSTLSAKTSQRFEFNKQQFSCNATLHMHAYVNVSWSVWIILLILVVEQGIALINGTQLMSSLGAEAVERALSVARQADVIAALTLEALKGTTKAFHRGTYRRLLIPWSIEPIMSHCFCNPARDKVKAVCKPRSKRRQGTPSEAFSLEYVLKTLCFSH